MPPLPPIFGLGAPPLKSRFAGPGPPTTLLVITEAGTGALVAADDGALSGFAAGRTSGPEFRRKSARSAVALGRAVRGPMASAGCVLR